MMTLATIESTRPAPYVLLLRFMRPHARNALSLELLRELAAALDETTRDEDIRCVVLTGDERLLGRRRY
jgi:enoyl-CoA hydratase/carnithine racemase